MSIEAEIAERAADLIEKGWVQHLSERRGRRCLVSGIGQAAFDVTKEAGIPERMEFCNHVFHAVFDHLGLESVVAEPEFRESWVTMDLVNWNDTEGRTQYEVVDALRHAAKDIRNESEAT